MSETHKNAISVSYSQRRDILDVWDRAETQMAFQINNASEQPGFPVNTTNEQDYVDWVVETHSMEIGDLILQR